MDLVPRANQYYRLSRVEDINASTCTPLWRTIGGGEGKGDGSDNEDGDSSEEGDGKRL